MSEVTIAPKDEANKKLLRKLESSGADVWACYQCGRCSSGCPVSAFFDLMPMEIIRLAAYGHEEELMKCHTIWLCASCETCTTRCPNDIDIAHTMDVLRQWALDTGQTPTEPKVATFHKAFLNSVKRGGRTFELGMIGEYKMRSGDLFSDMKLGMSMFGKGKLKLWPRSIKGKSEVREIFKRNRKE